MYWFRIVYRLVAIPSRCFGGGCCRCRLPHRFRSNNKNLLFVVQHRFISKQQDPQPTLTIETQEPYGKECLAAQPRGYLRFGSTTTSV